ncbi:hypothetical protein PAXRUDRAFT_824973 [Paxillus rubicundulus Ve08.2h10]|uniref:Uncharacterized protein n=1 Tax=Paxillus rubicundulus Ve08.2h10 TaxID=930991 RepID=A0A0D0E733_9AGAM|nr:hypothetical protein PAXRUDRAFT_824973 [Paxillus rubicundulus Ve08.2h10]
MGIHATLNTIGIVFMWASSNPHATQVNSNGGSSCPAPGLLEHHYGHVDINIGTANGKTQTRDQQQACTLLGSVQMNGLTKLAWLACAVKVIVAESGVTVSVQEYDRAVWRSFAHSGEDGGRSYPGPHRTSARA